MKMEFFKKYGSFILLLIFGMNIFAQDENSWQNQESFYTHYQGEIQDVPLIVNLRIIRDKISGNYIDPQGKMIFLEAEKRNSASTTRWHLIDPRNKSAEKWRIRQNAHEMLIERRIDSAQYLKFDAKEIPATRDFSVQVFNQEIPAEDGMSRFKISYIIPQLNTEDASAVLFNSELKKRLEIDPALALSAGIKRKLKSLEKDYFKSLKEENHSEDISALSGSWEYFRDLNIQWNANNYLTLSDSTYEFYGGAHGMMSLQFVHFDLHKNRLLELKDIIAVSNSDLEKELEKHFRKSFGLKPGEGLDKILFENHLKVTKNFRFDRTGIYFVYNSYEIAAYAMGKIEIFIPFTDLEAFMRNEFRTRMKIDLPKYN